MRQRVTATTTSSETEDCPYGTCDGSGIIIIERRDGREAAKSCKCSQSNPASRPLQYYFNTELGGELSGLSVEDFRLDVYEDSGYEQKMRKTKAKVEKYIDNFQIAYNDKGLGWYFWSPENGSGKTMLAAIIGNEVAGRYEYSSQIISTIRMLNRIKATFNDPDQSEQAITNCLTAADLLIIDDMGAHNDTEFARERIQWLIESRRSIGRPTIITSNYPIDKLPVQKRTKSRINEMMISTRFPNVEVRQVIAQRDKQQFLEDIE